MRRAMIVVWLVPLILFVDACGSSSGVENAAPRKPALVLNVGSLDLSAYNKRIERSELVRLSALLKKEGVDILGVQKITRYPSVATRTDFVDVLASLTGMRSAFGVSSDFSGRQTGHAIFSMYPVRTNESIPFENSDDFESALLLVVDAGVRDIQIANMLLPQKGTPAVKEKCVQTVVKRSVEGTPMLLIGNFSAPPFSGFSGLPDQKSGPAPVLVDAGETFEVLSVREAKSNFGELKIAQVGIYRK